MPTVLSPAAALLLVLAQSPVPPSTAPATPPSPGAACVPAPYRQFDFWIGEWQVVNQKPPAGRTPPPAKSRISRILDGCAVLEEYETPGGYTGKSLNFYDGKGGWHQTWIDNGGAPLFLKGGMQGPSMVLADDVNRITWTPMAGGNVRQHWEITKDSGRTWQTAFDGLYTARPPR